MFEVKYVVLCSFALKWTKVILHKRAYLLHHLKKGRALSFPEQPGDGRV